jgi:hypothetical protein
MTVETFLTAFLGASFAFLFFLAGEVFVRAYEPPLTTTRW